MNQNNVYNIYFSDFTIQYNGDTYEECANPIRDI